MSALAIAGATAVSTGIALPFIGKREPRYRIIDCTKSRLWRYEVRILVQTRICGVWWTIHKELKQFDIGSNHAQRERAKNWLREHLKGGLKCQKTMFDTKYHALESL